MDPNSSAMHWVIPFSVHATRSVFFLKYYNYLPSCKCIAYLIIRSVFILSQIDLYSVTHRSISQLVFLRGSVNVSLRMLQYLLSSPDRCLVDLALLRL